MTQIWVRKFYQVISSQHSTSLLNFNNTQQSCYKKLNYTGTSANISCDSIILNSHQPKLNWVLQHLDKQLAAHCWVMGANILNHDINIQWNYQANFTQLQGAATILYEKADRFTILYKLLFLIRMISSSLFKDFFTFSPHWIGKETLQMENTFSASNLSSCGWKF